MSLATQPPIEEAPPEQVAAGSVVEVAVAPTSQPRIVAMLNQKGGVGKTTSTVNLGAALARLGQRVLLVDLDPQSNLSLHFGVEPVEGQPTVHELLMDDAVCIEETTVTARPGLDFVPAVTELALVEGELADRLGMQHALRRKLEPVYERYDVILLDCPPSLGVLSVNALTVADEVLVPMQAHYLPLRGLEKLLQTVHMVSEGLNPRIRVAGVLLCMHEGNSGHARAVIADIEAQLAQFRDTDLPWSTARVVQPPVRRNIKLAEAPSFGKTIFDYAPSCPGAHDYRRIAESLLESWGRPVPAFEGARAARTPSEGRAVRATPTARARKVSRTASARPAKTARPTKAPKHTKVARTAKAARVARAPAAAKAPRTARSSAAAKVSRPARVPRASKVSRIATLARVSRTGRSAAGRSRSAQAAPPRAPARGTKARPSAAPVGKRKASPVGKARRAASSSRRAPARGPRRMRSGGLSL
jgi:chromosome partitioning protein